MGLRTSYTTAIERNIVWQGDFATEPYEAPWASEAIFFIRTLTDSPGGSARVPVGRVVTGHELIQVAAAERVLLEGEVLVGAQVVDPQRLGPGPPSPPRRALRSQDRRRRERAASVHRAAGDVTCR